MFGRGDCPEECVQELHTHGNTHELPFVAEMWDQCREDVHLDDNTLPLDTAVGDVVDGKRSVHVCKSGYARIRKGIKVSEKGRPCWLLQVAFCCAACASLGLYAGGCLAQSLHIALIAVQCTCIIGLCWNPLQPHALPACCLRCCVLQVINAWEFIRTGVLFCT